MEQRQTRASPSEKSTDHKKRSSKTVLRAHDLIITKTMIIPKLRMWR